MLRFYCLKYTVIGYYRKPISLPWDPIYGVGGIIENILGKSITVGSWVSLLKVFSTNTAGDQSNWYKLASDGKCKERVNW